MKLRFRVQDLTESVDIPEVEDFPAAVAQIHAGVLAVCGSRTPDVYLQARIADALLQAIRRDDDVDLGEVTVGT